jgi:hypothetical protein
LTGSDATKSGPISGVITNWPFGLRWLDASLARNLLYEIPADAVRPVSSRMRVRIAFAVADAVRGGRAKLNRPINGFPA